MTNSLQIFTNEEFGQLRTLLINGEPWAVGKDVATMLGYKETAKAIREHVEEDDKGVSVLDTPGGKQEMIIINESGLYSLILSSKLPKAKEFKHWITSEVLPSIRKTGSYSVKPITTVDGLLAAVQILKDHEDRLSAVEIKQQEQQTKLNAVTFLQKKAAEENTATNNRLTILEANNQCGAKYYPYPDGKITQRLLNRIWNVCTKLSQQLPEYDYSPEMWHVKYKEVLLTYLRSQKIDIHKELAEAKQYYTQVYTTEKAQGITPAKEVLRPADIKKVTLWQVLCLNPEYVELANAVIAEFAKHVGGDFL